MATYKLVNADQLDSDLTAVGDAIRSKGGTSAGLSFPAGMVSAIGAISTGVELNFDVVPGLTQPGTAAENTIWVQTEKINNWYFSATQPDGMQEWDVWFLTDTSSSVEFNALKKNGIQVYPLSAKQYFSGAWVDKNAKGYQGGEWVGWTTYLYNAGDECADITGGWTTSGYKWGNYGLNAVKNNNTITLSSVVGSANGGIGTVDKVNLIGKNTLFVEVNSTGNVYVFLSVQKSDMATNAILTQTYANPGDTTLEVPIPPTIDQPVYVVFSSGNATISKVWAR